MKHFALFQTSGCPVRHTRPVTNRMLSGCFRQAPRLTAHRAFATQLTHHTESSQLQQLYQQALASFGRAQQPTCPADVLAVSEALRAVPLQELGLQAEVQNSAGQSSSRGLFDAWPSFQSTKRDDCPVQVPPQSLYSIALPFSASALLSRCMRDSNKRVLYGQLHVKSYDWADAQQHTASHSTEPSAATLVMDEVIEPGSEPAVIFPTAGGNIHQFTAVTDCAVLDVLSPPYSPQGGRDCTYYRAVNDEHNGGVHLAQSDPSPPLNMQNKTYKGVRIQAAVVPK